MMLAYRKYTKIDISQHTESRQQVVMSTYRGNTTIGDVRIQKVHNNWWCQYTTNSDLTTHNINNKLWCYNMCAISSDVITQSTPKMLMSPHRNHTILWRHTVTCKMHCRKVKQRIQTIFMKFLTLLLSVFSILKTLLAELIEKSVEGKNHPKLLLRRWVSSNRFTLCGYTDNEH